MLYEDLKPPTLLFDLKRKKKKTQTDSIKELKVTENSIESIPSDRLSIDLKVGIHWMESKQRHLDSLFPCSDLRS